MILKIYPTALIKLPKPDFEIPQKTSLSNLGRWEITTRLAIFDSVSWNWQGEEPPFLICKLFPDVIIVHQVCCCQVFSAIYWLHRSGGHWTKEINSNRNISEWGSVYATACQSFDWSTLSWSEALQRAITCLDESRQSWPKRDSLWYAQTTECMLRLATCNFAI